MESENSPSQFGTLLRTKILPRVQILALVIGVVGILFKIFHYAGAVEFFLIGFSTLAACYFLLAFTSVQLPPTCKPSLYSLILYKVIYIASAITLIGIVFAFLNLPGASQLLLSGTLTLGIALVASAALVFSNKDNWVVLKNPLLRGIVLFVLGIYFLRSLSVI